ncbi:MerR family transcriptional regulator [Nocardioides alcanivorans]|uniref:MerR family transcriptional regulator n=1 Tax=Nocardioides alcanivorans TaxID=2897352 RepID=UPI001F1E87A4|nr:MerR family transcriptional regulator [Nocardioides alcanivorans]
MTRPVLTIAQAAAALGLTIDTLRYYERDGLLLRPVPRSASGHRRYDEEDVHWITLVTRLRSTGMPIRDVRRYADLVRAGDGNEPERLALLQSHREEVLRQLTEVTGHLGAIDHKIGIYEDRLRRASQQSA